MPKISMSGEEAVDAAGQRLGEHDHVFHHDGDGERGNGKIDAVQSRDGQGKQSAGNAGDDAAERQGENEG
jgi:hypothetical protein